MLPVDNSDSDEHSLYGYKVFTAMCAKCVRAVTVSTKNC